jgi:hypothetical protein
MSFPDSIPQQYVAAIPGIKLSDLVFWGWSIESVGSSFYTSCDHRAYNTENYSQGTVKTKNTSKIPKAEVQIF